MAPQFFGTIAEYLKSENILTGEGFERIVIEKPFGTSYNTAKSLNDSLSKVFTEEQIFRIDHYLGKETVLNLLALRFANSLFVNNWDCRTIDHVEITVAEEVGIEGRWGYFDQAG